jgi:co-chaperonin GroES (HSP10)
MPNTFLEPAGDHLLVIDTPFETTLDGISLPDNIRQREMIFGTVVFVGPAAIYPKIEDQVCYGPYAGKTVVFNGTEFRLLREGQIEMYIRKSQ